MSRHDRNAKQELDTSLQALFERRISRREFFRKTAALGVSAAFLTDILASQRSAAFAAEAPSDELLGKIQDEGGQLYILNWAQYIHPDTIPDFENEFGVDVTYDRMAGNEQLLTTLQAGNVNYDVVFPTHNFVPVLTGQNLLSSLNHDHLSLLNNNQAQFLDTTYDPGNEFTAPYMWGMTAMVHNTNYTEGDPNLDSWALMFESGPERYSGLLGFTNEREEVMAAALAYLGYSVNSRNESELREAGEVLLNLKRHIKSFYPGAEQTKALIQEEVVVSQQWNGEAVRARRENPAVQWSLPKEGGTAWVDNMAVPRGAPHQQTAHAFINYMMRPEVAARNAEQSGYATPNAGAVDQHVPREIASNPAIYPTEEELQRLEFLETIPDDVLPIYNEIWTNVLAS